jgi:dTDP-4-dehydrorhamnose reductase
MRLLLFGKNGQVGWELQRALTPLGELTALDLDSPGPLRADFNDPASVAATVRELRPDVIVNASAHTAVDQAESEPEVARRINAEAPAALARAAASCGAWLVHYSTDYVFDGSGSAPRTEEAPTGPLNVYGRTKLEGEQAIRAGAGRHLILRTSWVYGTRGGNFAKTMLRLAQERERLTVIDDQVGAPTGAELLADVTAHAIRAVRNGSAPGGTYHLAAAGETSWHGYACHVITRARAAGVAVRVANEAIEPVPSSAYATPAQRPKNSRLDTSKLRVAFDLSLPPWQAGVDRLLAELIG